MDRISKQLDLLAVARRVAWVGSTAVSLTAVNVGAQDRAGDDVAVLRALLDKHVEAHRVISQEKRDWTLGKEVLVDRAEIVRRETDALRGKIADADKSIADADSKREGLVKDNEGLQATGAMLGETVGTLEARTRTLLKRLPDPLLERIRPLTQRIPAADTETKLSLGERFQNVVGILNEVDKFNREIHVTSEVRTLADGTSAEVTAMYVGIGQAYFVNAKGDAAGIGSATADGFAWTPANSAAPAIARAVAILKNEDVADFVRLPIRID